MYISVCVIRLFCKCPFGPEVHSSDSVLTRKHSPWVFVALIILMLGKSLGILLVYEGKKAR